MFKINFLIVFVYLIRLDITYAKRKLDIQNEKPYKYKFSDECFYETKYKYNYTDLEPRVCVNYDAISYDEHYTHKRDNCTVVYYDIHYYSFGGAMTIATCIYRPQSIMKMTYYEKHEESYLKVFVSIDKGQVMSHIKLDETQSAIVVCETYDDRLDKRYVMNISFIFLESYLPYFIVNDMELHLMKRSLIDPKQKSIYYVNLVGTFEYFANPGELQKVKLVNPQEPHATVKSCNISSDYQILSADFAKEHLGEFIFNSGETKVVECSFGYNHSASEKIILFSRPYSSMPSSLLSDSIFITGLYWYNMINMYVIKNANNYNFTYTYNYNEKELKLTCVSLTEPVWQYDDKAIVLIDKKVKKIIHYSNINASYFTDLSFRLHENFNHSVLSCKSRSGHTATVILQRDKNYSYTQLNQNQVPSIKHKYQRSSKSSTVSVKGNPQIEDQDCQKRACIQAFNNTDIDNKVAEANKAFGVFIGHELYNMPVAKRRLIMYQIIQLLDNHS